MAAIISVSEIILLCLGGTIFIYRPGLRFSEALSSGILVALIVLSFIFQVAFLIGEPNLAFVLEGLIISGIFLMLRKKGGGLSFFYQRLKDFWIQNKLITILLSILWIYLGFQAVFLPPANFDSMTYNLARVLLFQQEKSLYLSDITTLRQAIFPVGSDLLHHIFLRFYTDYGIGIFSFLAYLSVGFGTYALSRRYTSRETSLIATLVIMSLPEFVYQATSTKNDIITVATAVFCCLTVHRLLERLNLTDLLLLILGLSFGISAKTTFMAFAIPFVLFFGSLLLRKYGLGRWIKLILRNWWCFILLIFPVFTLSQLWLFIHNYNFWGGWSGPPEYVARFQQVDGLKGGLANLVRYLIQSVHLLIPVDLLFNRISGFTLSGALQKVYEYLLHPFLGDAGMGENSSFSISWLLHEDWSWFGPFGFLLVIPAILYSSLKGKRSLNALSLTLLCYAFIVSYKTVWSPFKGRFFSLFFASSGICVAYFIDFLKSRRKWLTKLISYGSILILFLACTLNDRKPLLFSFKWPYTVVYNSIWTKADLGENRLYYAERYYGDSRLSLLTKLFPTGSKVALVTGDNSWIYHYLLLNPDVEFTPVKPSSLESRAINFEYILCLDIECDLNKIDSEKTFLWTSRSSARKGQLIHIKPSKSD